MEINPERLKQMEEFLARADRRQFDTQDYQIAKSLAEWYGPYMAELKKEHPSRARLEQLRDILEKKLASIDRQNAASDRPRGASGH
jgi:hypothetical protein